MKLRIESPRALVYKIPYRRARAWPRPSASREQRYLAYNARTVSGRDYETMTHVPRDTHVTKQRMAMRSKFPWSDFKKLGTPELSSSSSTSTALSPKNFEKRAQVVYI